MSLYAIGDLHGSEHRLALAMRLMDGRLTADDVLVCLGDVGIKHGNDVKSGLLHALAQLPCTVLVMRGNNDTRYWRDMQLGRFAWRAEVIEWQDGFVMRDPRRPNVLYVDDSGGLVTIDGHACLFVPGAWSIDGVVRQRLGLPFEHDEQLVERERDELLKLARLGYVEHVFSHTCPLSWRPAIDDLLIHDFTRKPDTTMEAWLDEVLDAVRPTCEGWWFGHYHDDRDVAGIGHLLYTGVRKVF